MRRFFHALIGLAMATACGGSGSTDTGRLTPARVNGNWSFTLTRIPSGTCSGGVTAGTLPTILAFRADGTTGDIGSYWSNDSSVPRRYPLVGSVDFTTGALDLRLWTKPNVTGIAITGTVRADGTFTGSGRDPAPGYSAVYVFGICDYTATGTRQ